MNQTQKQKRKFGFTLTELIVVIVIIGILAAVLIPTISGYIEKAKNSNDITLVRNMNNSIILASDNDLSTAENIRSLLKTQGIDDFKTNSRNNVILFNMSTKKFELKTEEVISVPQSATIVVYADEGGFKVNTDPLTLENIYENYMVVSTSGNDTSEALSSLHNLTTETNVGQQLAKIKNDKVKAVVQSYITSTAFVTADGSVISVNSNNEVVTDTKDKTRVVMSEGLTEVNLENLNGCLSPSAIIIIPNHIETAQTTEFSVKTAIITGKVSSLDKTDGLNVINEIDTAKTKIYTAVNSFADLKTKISAGYNKIYLTDDVTINENFTIPSDVILSLPYVKGEYEAEKVLYNTYDQNTFDDEHTVKNGVVLNITTNAKLTVAGTINIGGVIQSFNGAPKQGKLYGESYSQINIAENSSIELSGKMLAIGKIVGEGQVVVKSTGEVQDRLMINNWRGGSYTYACANDKYFPFTDYSLSNIEAQMTIEAGGNWSVFTKINMTLTVEIEVCFVGKNGLFKVANNGSFEKSYDATNKKDIFDFAGGMTDNALTISLLGKSVSTADFAMPIGVVEINLKNGAYEFKNTNFKFLPGSSLNIENSATLKTSKMLAFYGSDWEDKNTNTPYANNTASKININGTLELQDGASIGGVINLTGTIVISENTNTATVTNEAVKTSGSQLSAIVTQYQKNYYPLVINAKQNAVINMTLPEIQSDKYNYGMYTDAERTSPYTLGENDTVQADATIYPFNTEKTYNITLNLQDGTIPELLTDSKYLYVAEANLPMATKSGYKFLGWTTAENSSICIDEKYFPFVDEMNLYAQYEKLAPKTYEVVIHLEGAIINESYIARLTENKDVSNIVYTEGVVLSFTMISTEDIVLPKLNIDFVMPKDYVKFLWWREKTNDEDANTRCNSILVHSGTENDGVTLEFRPWYDVPLLSIQMHYPNGSVEQEKYYGLSLFQKNEYNNELIVGWYYFLSDGSKSDLVNKMVINPENPNTYIKEYYVEGTANIDENISIVYNFDTKEWSVSVDQYNHIDAVISYSWKYHVLYYGFMPAESIVSNENKLKYDIIDQWDKKYAADMPIPVEIECIVTLTFASGVTYDVSATTTEGLDIPQQ